MRTYCIKYKMYSADIERQVTVPASNMADACDRATYEAIPSIEGTLPYSAWVYSVNYANGKSRVFWWTLEGMPY